MGLPVLTSVNTPWEALPTIALAIVSSFQFRKSSIQFGISGIWRRPNAIICHDRLCVLLKAMTGAPWVFDIAKCTGKSRCDMRNSAHH